MTPGASVLSPLTRSGCTYTSWRVEACSGCLGLLTHGIDSQRSRVPRVLLCIMGSQAGDGDQPWRPVSTARSESPVRGMSAGNTHIGGAVLCSVGRVAAPLACTRSMPETSPEDHPDVTIKTVSRPCSMSLGGKIILWLRTTVLVPAMFSFLSHSQNIFRNVQKRLLILMLESIH